MSEQKDTYCGLSNRNVNQLLEDFVVFTPTTQKKKKKVNKCITLKPLKTLKTLSWPYSFLCCLTCGYPAATNPKTTKLPRANCQFQNEVED